MKQRMPCDYGMRFITRHRTKVKHPPLLEKEPAKIPETEARKKIPELVAREKIPEKAASEKIAEPASYILPDLEGYTETSRKTFKERQYLRLEWKAVRIFPVAGVPGGIQSVSSMEYWLRKELNEWPTYALPFLDVGKKTIYNLTGSYVVQVGTRDSEVKGGIQNGTFLHDPIYRERATYEKRKEMTIKMRFSRTLKLIAAVSMAWALACFAGFPPPQRILIESQRIEFDGYMKGPECRPLPYLEGLFCAERIYNHVRGNE